MVDHLRARPRLSAAGTAAEPPARAAAAAARLRGAVGYVVLAGLALVLPGLAVPAYSKVFVDRVLIGGLTDWPTPLVLGLPLTAPLWLAMLGPRWSC